MSNYPDDEYYDEDNWDDEDDYDDYDYDDEPDETSFDSFLCKAKNGHLFVEEVTGWKYRGQDWGETVGQWKTKRLRIRELAVELQLVAIRIGRDLKAGEYVACYLWDELEESELVGDGGNNDIPF